MPSGRMPSVRPVLRRGCGGKRDRPVSAADNDRLAAVIAADSRDRRDAAFPVEQLDGDIMAVRAENLRNVFGSLLGIDAAQRAGFAVENKREAHRLRQAAADMNRSQRNEAAISALHRVERLAEDELRGERRMRRRGLDADAALPGVPEEARRGRLEADDRQPVRRKRPEARPGRDRSRARNDRRLVKTLERRRNVEIVGVGVARLGRRLLGEAHHDRAGVRLEVVAVVDRRDEGMRGKQRRQARRARRSSPPSAASAAGRDARRRRARRPRPPTRPLALTSDAADNPVFAGLDRASLRLPSRRALPARSSGSRDPCRRT